MSPLAIQTSAEEETVILEHLDTEWAGRTPVAWPGRPFNSRDQTGPWLEPRITNLSAIPVTMGPEYRQRFPGLLLLTVHWPAGQGTTAAKDMAEDAAAFFRDQTLVAGLVFRGATINVLGTEDGWLRVQATVPFQRDTDFPLSE